MRSEWDFLVCSRKGGGVSVMLCRLSSVPIFPIFLRNTSISFISVILVHISYIFHFFAKNSLFI